MAIRVVHQSSSSLAPLVAALGVGLQVHRSSQEQKRAKEQHETQQKLAEEKIKEMQAEAEATAAERDFFQQQMGTPAMAELFPEIQSGTPEEQEAFASSLAGLDPQQRANVIKSRVGLMEMERKRAEEQKKLQSASEMFARALQSIGTPRETVPPQAAAQLQAVMEDVQAGRIDPSEGIKILDRIQSAHTTKRAKENHSEQKYRELEQRNAQIPDQKKRELMDAKLMEMGTMVGVMSAPEFEKAYTEMEAEVSEEMEAEQSRNDDAAMRVFSQRMQQSLNMIPPQQVQRDRALADQTEELLAGGGETRDQAVRRRRGMAPKSAGSQKLAKAGEEFHRYIDGLLQRAREMNLPDEQVEVLIANWIKTNLGIEDPTPEDVRVAIEEAGINGR